MRTGLIYGMLFMMVFLGLISQTDRTVPPAVIAVCSLIGLIGLVMWGNAQPDMPLYAMVAYLPFSKILVGDFGGIAMALNLTNLLVVIIWFNWVIGRAPVSHKGFQKNIMHLPVVLLTAWVLVSYLYSTFQYDSAWVSYYLGETIGDLKRWLDPVIIYFLYYHIVRDRQRWKTIVVILMIGVFIAAGMAVREYMSGTGSSSLESSRIGGIAGQPNILGAFFVYYMFLFAAFWIERARNIKYWALWLPFLMCFRAIMVTFSRGAYLAFALGVLGLAFFKNKLLFLLVCGAIIFSALNPVVLPEGIRYRLESTFKSQAPTPDTFGTTDLEESLDTSSAVRLQVWQAAGLMIKDNPVFGVGLGRFPFQVMNYSKSERFIDAHNAYIIAAAEFGIPGLIFFIMLLLVVYRITVVVYYKHPDPFIKATALGFLGGLSGLFMANMFGSRLNTTEVSGYFWVLTALMARAYLWVKEGAKTGLPEDYGPAFSPTAGPGKRRR